tara:strand:- start:17666 stop:18073 length:408 start_codon:yes stop_codon:yes gene_type:complete
MKIPYNWSKVDRGDIISFQYRGTNKRLLRRTVLVLEKKLDGLLHGILLEMSNKIINNRVNEILELAGETKVVDSKKKVYRVELSGKTKDVYKKLKEVIKKYGIYRTFKYEKAVRSQVFLEDLRLPIGFVEELNEN